MKRLRAVMLTAEDSRIWLSIWLGRGLETDKLCAVENIARDQDQRDAALMLDIETMLTGRRPRAREWVTL